MSFDFSDLESLPDDMNLEQMRIVCHIAKRTAAYLLQSGLVPCKMTGKKTRCYHIRKEDVIAFLLDREECPDRYIVPRRQGSKASSRERKVPLIPSKTDKRNYYTRKLLPYQDIISVKQICEITGYKSRAVRSWIREGHLKCLMKTDKYYVIKASLLDYLCSDQYAVAHIHCQQYLDTFKEIMVHAAVDGRRDYLNLI